MSRILVVPDSVGDTWSDLLVTNHGPVSAQAVAPGDVAPTWAQVLAAGADSGVTNPRLTYGTGIRCYDIGVEECGFIGLNVGSGEVQIAAYPTSSGSYPLRLYSEAGGGLAFNDGLPAYKPSITGSRGGNAALASLLTTLASMGLITDNTTA